MTRPVETPRERRTFLQRALLVVGGALGLSAAAAGARSAGGAAPAAEPSQAPAARALTLHGRRRSPAPPGRLLGAPARERLVRNGELLAGPAGPPIGEFSSSGFSQEGPFGAHAEAGGCLEFQTFRLEDGTLFGIGAAAGGRGQRAFAIVGGTGRFAGAQGSYVEREAADPEQLADVVFEVRFV